MPFAFEVGRLFGIRIRVHALFLAMVALFWLTQSSGEGAIGRLTLLAYLGLLFVFVLIHELGHAVMARRFGVQVIDITLWPLGGMARLSRVPETPHIELLIAAAGPVVNIVLTGLLLAVAALGNVLASTEILDPGRWFAMTDLGVGSVLAFSIGVNLIMGTFNLLPAFPLDGGRVLRALLGARLDFVAATVWAVRLGRVVAILVLVAATATDLLGITELPLLGFFLVAVFVHVAGAQEELQVRIRAEREKEAETLTTPRPAAPPRFSREEYQKLVDRLPGEEP